MTGAAGLALLHLRHVMANAMGAANKNCTVTVTTFKERCMGWMTETGIKGLKGDIFYILMTLLAIALD